MQVIVLIEGMYSDQGVTGVFSSFEELCKRFPNETWEESDCFEGWINTKNFGEYLRAERHEIDKVSDDR